VLPDEAAAIAAGRFVYVALVGEIPDGHDGFDGEPVSETSSFTVEGGLIDAPALSITTPTTPKVRSARVLSPTATVRRDLEKRLGFTRKCLRFTRIYLPFTRLGQMHRKDVRQGLIGEIAKQLPNISPTRLTAS
jgi:hypothetical protein